jgi:hypothetical protein
VKHKLEGEKIVKLVTKRSSNKQQFVEISMEKNRFNSYIKIENKIKEDHINKCNKGEN